MQRQLSRLAANFSLVIQLRPKIRSGIYGKALAKRGRAAFYRRKAKFLLSIWCMALPAPAPGVMTSSSSPGISLKQEGISYIACAELPCVVVNMMRGGPGLGSIQPSQGDYFQATKGGGHGDYHTVVLAPASIQEAADLVMEGFDIADEYRIPVLILGDGMIGQMMEPVEFRKPPKRNLPEKTWATTGWKDKARQKSVVNSLYIETVALEAVNKRLQARYVQITQKETRFEEYRCENAEIIIAAYGTVSRIAKNAIEMAAKEGIKVGMIRPITLWPFPSQAYADMAEKENVKAFLTVEMSAGQMVEDVKLAVNGKKPVKFFGKMGGSIPTPAEILAEIKKIKGGN